MYNLSYLQFMTKEEKLTWLYLYICEAHDAELCLHCQRMSNKYAPKFSETNLITTYLFAIIEQKSFHWPQTPHEKFTIQQKGPHEKFTMAPLLLKTEHSIE